MVNKVKVLKYVCMKDPETNEEMIFTCPLAMDHDAFTETLRDMRDKTHGNWSRIYRNPISAGFVNNRFECFGRSETLNLGSRGSIDTILLKGNPQ